MLINEVPGLSPSATQECTYRQVSSGSRIAELDGLRGLAAVAVVVAHYLGEVGHGLPGLFIGWMGVDLFFVLSGFLIGSIILERKGSENFLRIFYRRRALRIIPIYLLTVGFVLLFVAISRPAPWLHESLPALSYLTFTQNIVMAARGDYGTYWLLPTWTLAVEEQFYLVIPLLIMVVPSRWLPAAILGGVAVGCGVRALFYYAGWGEIGGRVLLLSRCDILLCGVLAAYIHQRLVVNQTTLRLIPLAAVLGTVLAAVHFHLTRSSLFFVLSPLFMAALFAAYVMLAARGWEVFRPLRSAGWRFFGSISYGLYLVHQPVAGAMHGLMLGGRPDIATLPQLAVTVAATAASIAIALASWTFIESPLVRLGRRSRYAPGSG